MADLSLSLTNKGKPGGFSLSNINASKLTTNTFGTQGFNVNAKNTSNVNSKEVHKVTKAGKKEKPASDEEKPPEHNEVFPSSPSPQGGYDVTDLLGRRHRIFGGKTSDEALDDILGKNWLSRDLWNVGEGIVQGLAIEATAGVSQLIIGGRAWMSIQAARRALIGVKAGVSSARYFLDPSQSHGDPNGLLYSIGLGIGGQIKFGNLHDAVDGLVSHNSSLYKLAHTSHIWHEWAAKNSLSLSFDKSYNINSGFDFGKGVTLKSLSSLSDYKFNTSLRVNNLYNNFGLDNLEKQWFTATNLYKGKAFKSPYQYKMEKYGAHYGEKDDYYGKINSKLDSELENIEVSAGKFGTAYDRYVSRENEYKAEGMNFLGNAVGEQRNKGQFLSEVMDENHIHIQTDNWLIKEQIVNGNLYEKTLGIISLPGQTAANLLVGAQNLTYAARGFVNSAVETVVTPFGELVYDAYMYALIKLTVKDPATTTKVKKQEKKANGTTTLFINSKSYQFKMLQQQRDAEMYSGTYKTNEMARLKKALSLSKEQMDKIASNKVLYDRRAELQKELSTLKKEHESGWVFTKPWTDNELTRAKYLTNYIKQYNELIQAAENFGRTTPSKVSVETPKKKH